MNVECLSLKEVKWELYRPDMPITLQHCHVWLMDVDAYAPTLSSFESLLSGEEQQKAARYVRIADRIRFKLGRVMLRTLLSRFLEIPPHEVPITKGVMKKPELGYPYTGKLHFNISHSDSRIAIAMSNCPVGIDIEFMHAKNRLEDIIPTVFSSKEAYFLRGASSLREAFYLLWTRKEALLKALGLGLIEELAMVPSLDGRHQAYPDGLSGQTDQYVASLARHNYLLSTCYADVSDQVFFWDY